MDTNGKLRQLSTPMQISNKVEEDPNKPKESIFDLKKENMSVILPSIINSNKLIFILQLKIYFIFLSNLNLLEYRKYLKES